jgi:hypothetical protein
LIKEPPAPRLLNPILEKVVLSGKVNLDFEWEISNIVAIDHCEFKLYKGYDMYAANLILKEKIPSPQAAIKISSGLFENNQVYTWSVKQVNLAGQKSDPSFCSFKVIK